MHLLPFLFFVAILCSGCSTAPDPTPIDVAAKRAEWGEWVAGRDSFFAASGASPLLDSARVSFDGLTYFPYDTALVVPASLEPSLDGATVSFPTTTGELRPMVRMGRLVFQAADRRHRLTVYLQEPANDSTETGRLFVPFRDETSGTSTYAGGRYLDIPVESEGTYVIDFNRAYQPYCVYNLAYSCPLPPPENTLGLTVTAGERYPDGYTPTLPTTAE